MKMKSVEFPLFIFFTYNNVTQQIQSKPAGHVAEAHANHQRQTMHYVLDRIITFEVKIWLGFTQ